MVALVHLLCCAALASALPDDGAVRFLQQRAVAKKEPEPQGAESDAGARMWLSKRALNYVAEEIFPQMIRSLKHLHLSDFEGTYNGVAYRLWDVDLSQVGMQKPSIHFQRDEGIQFCLQGIWANMSSDWSADWYFISLAGGSSVYVTDGQLCATLGLSTDAGRPEVLIHNLDVSLELGPVSFTGTSIHWLMNAAAYLFESYLEDMAASTIKSKIEVAVSQNLAKSLRDMNLVLSMEVPTVNKTISVDMSLDSIQTKDSYLQVDVNGETASGDTKCPIPRSKEHSTPPADLEQHMVSGTLSKWGVECGIWAVNSTGLLSYDLLPWFIPDNQLGIKLDTDFMSLLVPGLKDIYSRTYPLMLTMSPVGRPNITFETGYVYLDVPMSFVFTTLRTETRSEFCFSFFANVHAHGHAWIEHKPMGLRTNLTLLGATDVKEGGSIAGPIDLRFAKQLLQVLRGPGQDSLNFGPLNQTLPLGSDNPTFGLKNVDLDVTKGGLYFFSDISVNLSLADQMQELLGAKPKKSTQPN